MLVHTVILEDFALKARLGYVVMFCLEINKYTGQVSCELITKMTQR